MRFSRQKIKQKLFLIKSKISSLKSRLLENPPVTRTNQPKTDIFIWGCNEFSLHLYHLLTRNNVNVIGFIENKTEQNTYCNKPVYKPQDFKTKTEYFDTPIVVASAHNMGLAGPIIDFETIRQFKLKLMEIINDYKINNCLLHPAALVDVSNCMYTNKIITFGLMGTGNTIYNHIFIKLNEAYEKNFKTRNNDTIFFEKMCFEYEQCIKQIMTDAIFSIGGKDIAIVPWNVGESMMVFNYENKKTTLYKLTTHDHITHRAFGYHNIPSMKVLDNLTTQKFKLFLIIRNPLDVILSILKKRKKIDIQTNTIDIDEFHSVSQLVVSQYAQWKLYYSKLEILKYESLIENPIQQILSIMQKLNLTPVESIAKTIWGELGFKQLPHAIQGHFKGGGSGKWEQVFQPEHLVFLSRLGIESTLKEHGYYDALDTFTKKMKSLTLKDYKQIEINKPGPEFFTLDNPKYLKNLHKDQNFVESGWFYFTSDNDVLINKMKNMLNTEYIENLVAAGTIPTSDQHSIQAAI